MEPLRCLLADDRIEVSLHDNEGNTPLMRAIHMHMRWNWPCGVIGELLFYEGKQGQRVDVNMANNAGVTAFEYLEQECMPGKFDCKGAAEVSLNLLGDHATL